MKRVNVKGTSGSGKTTFALELARRLELPFVELDALHHGPDWYQPSAEEFSATVASARAPSLNVTVPVGTMPAGVVTVAVNFTLSP